jgi:Glycosyltransferase
MMKAAVKSNASIIHFHNAGLMGYVSLNVARLLGKPYILEFHGLQIGSDGDGTKLSRIRKRGLSIERMLSCKADKVFVQTPKMAKSLMGAYHIPVERVTVLENVVDTDFFNPRHYVNCRSKYREKWSLGADDVLFLYAGYLDEINGILELMEAFSKLLLDSKSCLIIAGEGPLVDDVVKMNNKTSSHVRYVGKIDKKEMPEIYAATDVLMLVRPDRHETREATPMKLLEAMAMEKLVVCSNVEGLTRVCDEDSGVIIPPGDFNALKNTIEQIENDLASLRVLGGKARKKIVRHFSSRDESTKLDNLYLKLAGH